MLIYVVKCVKGAQRLCEVYVSLNIQKCVGETEIRWICTSEVKVATAYIIPDCSLTEGPGVLV